MAKKLFQIPFTQNGDLLHYNYIMQGSYIEDNFEFDDVLTFSGFSRGRSAAYAEFKRSGGETYGVFLSDLTVMIPHIKNGMIKGRFTFCKKGQNFGCTLITAATD